MRAVYLVRIDDVCPTMNWRVWEAVEEALAREQVRPIIAVVPDNQDPYLRVDTPDPRFWDRVLRWQDRGWTIGAHGYQHRYLTRDSGVIGLNHRSEFAGLPAVVQEEKLRASLDIFEQEGVHPRIWVAPSHSFDETTVATLMKLGLSVLSDGLSLFPYLDPAGLLRVPQQLWRFRRMPFGVWTVCCHVNGWTDEHVTRFSGDLRAFRDRIVDLDTVAERYGRRRRSVLDELVSGALLSALRLRRRARRLSPARGVSPVR